MRSSHTWLDFLLAGETLQYQKCYLTVDHILAAMAKTLLLLVLLTLTIACPGQSNPGKAKLRPEIQVIVDGMAADNILKRECVGMGCNRTVQWGRFEKLREIATNNELVALTDHENAVVKCYAFDALSLRKDIAIFPILIAHISDTAGVEVFSGCTSVYESARQYFLGCVRPDGRNTQAYELTQSQEAILDSIFLFNDEFKDDYLIDLFLRRMRPDLKYYGRIREMTLTGKRPVSLLILAKFKNRNDVGLIKKTLENEEFDSYGVLSAREFPQLSFYPLLKMKFKKKIAGLKQLEYDYGWGILCEALAKYPSKETCQLFEKVTHIKYEDGYASIARHILIAINKYPNEIFEPLKQKIKLGESDLKGIAEEAKHELWW